MAGPRIDELPGHAETIGPVPMGKDGERVLVRVPRSEGAALATALKISAAGRSARKAAEPVKLVLDAQDLL